MADSKKGVLRPQMLNVPDGFKRSTSYEGQVNWLAAMYEGTLEQSSTALERAGYAVAKVDGYADMKFTMDDDGNLVMTGVTAYTPDFSGR